MPYAGRVRIMLAGAMVAVIVLSGGSACAQPNPYHAVENWPTLPEGRTLGMVVAVAVDRDGNVWIADRCGTDTCFGSNLAPIFKFDPSGKLLKNFGEGMFVAPHGIYVDKGGNLWVTDIQGKEGKGLQVIKFSPEGKVLISLGKAGGARDDPGSFKSATSVVVASNGDIFVSDGHGSANKEVRVVKFSKDGRFIKAWGKKGSAPSEFGEPHSVAMDSKGRLFVCDQTNNRIQIFDQDGKFLEEWKQFGRPSGIFIDANDTMYVTDFQSDAEHNPGFQAGIRIGSAKDGLVTAFIPALHNEGIAADATGNIYGGEGALKSMRKYVKN
jgi:streptogramin lyase